MKLNSVLILICLFLFDQGFAQDPKTELERFVRNEFNNGELTLKIVKNQWNAPKKEFPTDQNGKILDPRILFESKLSLSEVELRNMGVVQLRFKYSDSLLCIQPLENSIFPEIEIDLGSSVARINGLELSKVAEMDIKDSKNLFGSPWNGFQWKSNKSNGNTEKGLKLTLGKITENGKKYIEVLWFEKDIKRHYRLLG